MITENVLKQVDKKMCKSFLNNFTKCLDQHKKDNKFIFKLDGGDLSNEFFKAFFFLDEIEKRSGNKYYVLYKDEYLRYQYAGNSIDLTRTEKEDIKNGANIIHLSGKEGDTALNIFLSNREQYLNMLDSIARKNNWLSSYYAPPKDDTPCHTITMRHINMAAEWWEQHNKKVHKGKNKVGYHFEIAPTHIDDMLYCVCDECFGDFSKMVFDTSVVEGIVNKQNAWEKTRLLLDTF